jgi:hypothetical protein
MRGTELEIIAILCARTCGNASTGASQVKYFASQLTNHIYFLKEDYYV